MIAPAHRRSDSRDRAPSRNEAWQIATSQLETEFGPGETPDGLADRVAATVGRHPLIALTAATAVGVLAGWLVKRKL